MRSVHPPRWSSALLTGAEAGEADRAAVARGDTWEGLLTRAGGALARGVADVLRERTGGVYGRRVVVVVGKGDNGGDGWVCAARLRDRGVAVSVVAVHDLEVEMSEHSSAARVAWLDSGGRAAPFDAGQGPLDPAGAQPLPDLVVDCVLGTGARGAPRGDVAPAVRAIRRVGGQAAVVACDVPSGVDADTGAVADSELVVDADLTVTFGAAKRGLYLHPGSARAGEVVVADLGRRWELPDRDLVWRALGHDAAVPRPWTPGDDKRSRGRVAVLAGSQRYGGAAALCGGAALRIGAGLVTVVTSGDRVPVLALDPGLMVQSLPAAQDAVGGPARAAVDAVREVLADADTAVVGPGLGHQDGTREVVEAVLDAPAPDGRRRVVVLDADGLNVFRHEAAALAGRGCVLVLTPHERELARLLDVEVEEVATDRAAAALELSSITGAHVVAKGPSTLCVPPEGPVGVATSGGPALGSGGTGDVLAGMLGGGLATDPTRGRDRTAGIVAGVVVAHGLTGEAAGRAAGGRATARDLLDHLPAVLAQLAARRPQAGAGW